MLLFWHIWFLNKVQWTFVASKKEVMYKNNTNKLMIFFFQEDISYTVKNRNKHSGTKPDLNQRHSKSLTQEKDNSTTKMHRISKKPRWKRQQAKKKIDKSELHIRLNLLVLDNLFRFCSDRVYIWTKLDNISSTLLPHRITAGTATYSQTKTTVYTNQSLTTSSALISQLSCRLLQPAWIVGNVRLC